MASETEVTEVIGEDAEGNVLQAIAGPGNWYAMVIMEQNEDNTLSLRLSSNLGNDSIKALLIRTANIL